MNKEFYIVRGLPGSGKSHTASIVVTDSEKHRHFEADMYFMVDGVYSFDYNELHLAHSWCFRNVEECLRDNKIERVVVSNTFTTKKEMRQYFELGKKYAVKPQVITCQGVFGNIHGVPPDVLEKMETRFDFKCVKDLFDEYFPN